MRKAEELERTKSEDPVHRGRQIDHGLIRNNTEFFFSSSLLVNQVDPPVDTPCFIFAGRKKR